jgi:hypothetical protein
VDGAKDVNFTYHRKGRVLLSSLPGSTSTLRSLLIGTYTVTRIQYTRQASILTSSSAPALTTFV